jgi:hypothetical protein
MAKTSRSSKKNAKLDHSGAIFVVLFGNASISRIAFALVHIMNRSAVGEIHIVVIQAHQRLIGQS